ncbi:uncharacterized protein LOC116250479 [Nymphaea colorata]|nr:uncharacterized protein LOC116250479 [Nymphaea colorata]XP_031479974.1 uncharacterized protein LOC116250479 [Nymphaea colorata]
MEVARDFCSSEAVALRQMAASLVEAVAVEAVLVAQKSVYLLLAMGSLLNGRNFLDQESEKSQGFDDNILIGMEDKNTRHVGDGVAPENKDDGDSDNDDEDEDDEDGEEQDDDGEGDEEDASGDEDNNNQGDDQEDDVVANGEGGSDDEDDDDEEEDEDEDDEDEDGEDEDEEDEEEEEEDEEIPEPPTKKRK